MRILIVMAALCLAIPASFHSPARAQTLAPLEAYGELPDIWGLDFSPDGTRFAFFKREGDAETVQIFEMGVGNIGAVNVSSTKPRGLYFISHNHVVIITSQATRLYGGYEDYQYSSYDIETGKLTTLASKERGFEFEPDTVGGYLTPSENPDEAYFTALVGSRSVNYQWMLLRGNLKTGRAFVESKGGIHARRWIVKKDGVVMARADYDGKTNHFSIHTERNGNWEQVYEEWDVEGQTLGVMGYTPDESALVVWRDERGRDFQTIHHLSFDGELSEPKYNTDVREPENVYIDPWGKFRGVQYAGMKPTYYFEDAGIAAAMNSIASLYFTDSVTLIDWTEDLSRLILRIDGGKTAPAYYLFDRERRALEKLTNLYLRIDDPQIMPVSILEYQARDGLVIPSLLTHPRNAQPGDKRPLIVYPHGGPEAHDSIGFSYRAQYFASRGYLVFQPNFRGSSGFGSAHRNAGYGEWGGKMLDDITDGVNYLIESGWADPDRICIMGASYGGYAALASGAFSPELYQCVIGVSAVTDMPLMVNKDRRDFGSYSAAFAYLTRLLGDLMGDNEALKRISPVNAASSFQAPVLLIHGNDDTVVEYEHSARMESALLSAGKSVRLVKLKGEDHNLSTTETRLQALQEVDRFVRETIGPAQ